MGLFLLFVWFYFSSLEVETAHFTSVGSDYNVHISAKHQIMFFFPPKPGGRIARIILCIESSFVANVAFGSDIKQGPGFVRVGEMVGDIFTHSLS